MGVVAGQAIRRPLRQTPQYLWPKCTGINGSLTSCYSESDLTSDIKNADVKKSIGVICITFIISILLVAGSLSVAYMSLYLYYYCILYRYHYFTCYGIMISILYQYHYLSCIGIVIIFFYQHREQYLVSVFLSLSYISIIIAILVASVSISFSHQTTYRRWSSALIFLLRSLTISLTTGCPCLVLLYSHQRQYVSLFGIYIAAYHPPPSDISPTAITSTGNSSFAIWNNVILEKF